MKKTLNIIAAAATLVLANAALSPVAEAGGVRLQFGFPLGSFVARPSGSSGASSYRRHDYAAARRAAARREAIAEAAAARRAKVAAAKAEARREALADAAAARRAKVAAARAEAASREKEVEVARVEPQTLAPNAVPLPEQKRESDVYIGETNIVIDKPAAAASARVEEKTKVVASKTDTIAPANDCRRFVPSAGLTITVPCVQ